MLHHFLVSLEFLAIQGDLEDPGYLVLQLVLGSRLGLEFLLLVGLFPLVNHGRLAAPFHPLALVDQVLLAFHLILVHLAGFPLEVQLRLLDLEVQEGLRFHQDLPFLL